MRSLPIVLLLVLVTTSYSQPSTGVLRGKVNTHGTKATVRIRNARSKGIVAEPELQYQNDSIATFSVNDIALGNYYVQLMRSDAYLATKAVSITSAIPVEISIEQTVNQELVISGDYLEPMAPLDPPPAVVFDGENIQKMNTVSGSKTIEAVILNTPGVVPDEDGRMHVRGEDANFQYIIDGIPVTANMTRIYAPLFNASTINSADLKRGMLGAEYGIATSGILNVTTRSGFNAPYFGEVSARVGSLGTLEQSVSGGGNIGNKAGLFFGYSGSVTDRYLDPIMSPEPNHTDGSDHHYFGKLDFLISDNMDLVVLGMRNLASFGIANSTEDSKQDQRQKVDDYMLGARLGITLSDNSALALVGYARQYRSENTSGGLMQITSPEDSIKAVTQNEDYFIGARRNNSATGGSAEFTLGNDWLGQNGTFKMGVGYESFPLNEYFTFAVTNPTLSSGDSVIQGDPRLLPYDITQGGKPFLVDTSNTGSRISVYATDRFTTGNWTIDAGLRFDRYSLFEDENAISPRLNAWWKMNEDWTLRASYNRIVMQAPLENILVASSPEALELSGTAQGNIPLLVKSEKSHNIELGAFYTISRTFDLDVSAYGKLVDDMIAKSELGVSGVIFPLNLTNAMVVGFEAVLGMHNWNNISGSLGLSIQQSHGLIPEDGSSPVSGGLIIGEEGYFYTHPWTGEDQFPTEHDQTVTAYFNFRYDHPSGFYAGLGGRFDSGLPFDLVDTNGQGPDAERSREILKERGYTDDVIDLLELEGEQPGSPDKAVAPHATFDLMAGFDFEKDLKIPVEVRFNVTNVLDTRYLYKFESSYGGTHFGLPRMLLGEIRVKI